MLTGFFLFTSFHSFLHQFLLNVRNQGSYGNAIAFKKKNMFNKLLLNFKRILRYFLFLFSLIKKSSVVICILMSEIWKFHFKWKKKLKNNSQMFTFKCEFWIWVWCCLQYLFAKEIFHLFASSTWNRFSSCLINLICDSRRYCCWMMVLCFIYFNMCFFFLSYFKCNIIGNIHIMI